MKINFLTKEQRNKGTKEQRKGLELLKMLIFLLILMSHFNLVYSYQIEIFQKNSALNQNNITQPSFYITNNGADTLSDFKVFYFFKYDKAKQLILEKYYTPNSTVSIVNIDDSLSAIEYFYKNQQLLSGTTLPNLSGNSVGLHYSDWSNWNKLDDPSFSNSSDFVVAKNMLVINGNGDTIKVINLNKDSVDVGVNDSIDNKIINFNDRLFYVSIMPGIDISNVVKDSFFIADTVAHSTDSTVDFSVRCNVMVADTQRVDTIELSDGTKKIVHLKDFALTKNDLYVQNITTGEYFHNSIDSTEITGFKNLLSSNITLNYVFKVLPNKEKISYKFIPKDSIVFNNFNPYVENIDLQNIKDYQKILNQIKSDTVGVVKELVSKKLGDTLLYKSLKFNPFKYRYDSTTKSFNLVVYNFFKVKAEYKLDGSASENTINIPVSVNVLKLYLNKSVNGNYYATSVKAKDYGVELIIVGSRSYAPQISKYVRWKKRMGFDVKVCYSEHKEYENYISPWDSVMVQDTINYYAHTYPLAAILLFGDTKTVNTKYYSYTDHYNKEHIVASDISYVDFDNDDVEDIPIARISIPTEFMNNKELDVSVATTIVDKILNYQKNPPDVDRFYKTVLFNTQFQNTDSWEDHSSEPNDFDSNAINYEQSLGFVKTTTQLEDIFNDFNIVEYYEADKSIANFDTLYYNEINTKKLPYRLQPYNPNFIGMNSSPRDITTAWEKGCGITFYNGHGGTTCWEKPFVETNNGVEEGMYIWNLPKMNNGDLTPVIFAPICLTGTFDLPEKAGNSCEKMCFAEFLLAYGPELSNIGSINCDETTVGGAVGYFGASSETWGEFYTDIDKLISHSIINNTDYFIGNTIQKAKQSILSTGLEGQCSKYTHWFGDPLMRIWTSNPNKNLCNIKTLESNISYLSKYYDILSNLSGINGARVTLYKDGRLLGFSCDSKIDQITIANKPLTPGRAIITATAPNMKPASSFVDFRDSIMDYKYLKFSRYLPSFAIYGKHRVRANDRSKVLGVKGRGFANVGGGSIGDASYVDIGVETNVGNVVAHSKLNLRSNCRVYGNAISSNPITSQYGSLVTGITDENVGDMVQNCNFSLDTNFEVGEKSVEYDNYYNQVPRLSPGKYGNIKIKANTRIMISSGIYYINSFVVEPNVQMEFNTKGGPVIFFVKHRLTFNNGLEMTNQPFGSECDPSKILFITGDTEYSTFIGDKSKWRGTIIAPNGIININADKSDGADIQGSFYAKEVYIHQNSEIVWAPIDMSIFGIGIKANAGDDQVVYADDNEFGKVSLNGNLSVGYTENIEGIYWYDNNELLAQDSLNIDVWLPVGKHNIKLYLEGDKGSVSVDSLMVNVIDTNKATHPLNNFLVNNDCEFYLDINEDSLIDINSKLYINDLIGNHWGQSPIDFINNNIFCSSISKEILIKNSKLSLDSLFTFLTQVKINGNINIMSKANIKPPYAYSTNNSIYLNVENNYLVFYNVGVDTLYSKIEIDTTKFNLLGFSYNKNTNKYCFIINNNLDSGYCKTINVLEDKEIRIADFRVNRLMLGPKTLLLKDFALLLNKPINRTILNGFKHNRLLNNNLDFIVYPNPYIKSSTLFYKISSLYLYKNLNYEIRFVKSTGNYSKIYKDSVSLNEANNGFVEKVLDVSELSSGIYYCSFFIDGIEVTNRILYIIKE